MTNIQLNTAQIRITLDTAFDDSGFSAFCFDYFPTVYNIFSQGMRKDDKITCLLAHCRGNPTGFERLLDNVHEAYRMSNFQREELKPLIEALSVHIDLPPPIVNTTKDGVASGSDNTHTQPKVPNTLPMPPSRILKEDTVFIYKRIILILIIGISINSLSNSK